MEAAFYGTLFTGLILLGISAVKSCCRRLAGGGGGGSQQIALIPSGNAHRGRYGVQKRCAHTARIIAVPVTDVGRLSQENSICAFLEPQAAD